MGTLGVRYLLRQKRIAGVRVENADYLMAMGLAGSLDDAFRQAGSVLAQWLQQDYKLTGKETVILLGTVIEYQISENSRMGSCLY